jgi:hypothetical protein
MNRPAVIAMVGFGLASVMIFASLGCSPEEPLDNTAAAAISAPAPTPQEVSASPADSVGLQARAEAASADQFLFYLFYRQEDAATQTMRAALESALEPHAARAVKAEVCVADAAERALVEEYDLSRAPMPLVLALAPNGAVTGGFTENPKPEEIAAALVSPVMARCLKATQAQKLVLLIVDPADANAAAPQGVQEFANDPQYTSSTEIVTVAYGNTQETEFLKALEIQATPEPVTALLVPPGQMIATFAGPVKKADIVTALRNAQNSCCPGGQCGPGGCGPNTAPAAK